MWEQISLFEGTQAFKIDKAIRLIELFAGIAVSKTTREGSTRADASDYISSDLPSNKNITGMNCVNFRIRKLTPRECYRLMGFTDRDYAKAKFNACDQEEIVELFLALDDKLQRRVMTKKEYRQYRILFEGKKKERTSDSQLYKQAGNSIVVQVLEAIFGQML